jgi:hypothetical protein
LRGGVAGVAEGGDEGGLGDTAGGEAVEFGDGRVVGGGFGDRW